MQTQANEYEARVARNLKGLEAVSTGPCPGCAECASDHGMTRKAFREAWERGEIASEGWFSWSECDICDNPLGGNREVWHAWYKPPGKRRATLEHFSGACADCVAYLANGTLPE